MDGPQALSCRAVVIGQAADPSFPSGAFTFTNALATSLTTEGLLFAALSLTASLWAPSGKMRRFAVRAEYLAVGAVLLLFFVAAGALVAWWHVFITLGWPDTFPERVAAISMAAAIALHPVLAALLATGLRLQK